MEPHFPPELEQLIAQTTATRYKGTIPSMLRVARRFHAWLEPLLYRVLRISKDIPADPLLRLLEKPDLLRDSVRFLAVDWRVPIAQDQLKSLLGACTGVIDAGLVPTQCTPEILPLLGAMKLQRFTGHLAGLFGHALFIEPDHDFFASLTHMELFDDFPRTQDPYGKQEHWLLASLPHVPTLTHLAFSDPGYVSWFHLEGLLVEMPQLVMLAAVWDIGEVRYMYERVNRATSPGARKDPRFMAGVYTAMKDNMWIEWEASARGARDYWARGEEFLRRKKAGEVRSTRIWMDDWICEAYGDDSDEENE